MTLHETAEFAKKFGVGTGIGIGAIIVLVILFNAGVFIKNLLLPPKIAPANEKLGKLPPIEFPQSPVQGSFTYSINTVDNNLPNFPDRVIIYPMVVPQPNLNNLQAIRDKVGSLGFQDSSGNVLPEISRGGSLYEWDEPTGLQRKIIYDNVTFAFNLDSNYLTSLDVLNGKNIKDQAAAFTVAQSFLSGIDSLPADLDFNLTTDPDPANDYTIAPELYTINSGSGELAKTTSLSDTKVIRVDFYQKAIEYSLTAATGEDLSHFQNFDEKIPVMYPNPPYSTMDFYVASGPDQAQVMAGSYAYQAVDTSANTTPDQLATYPIKSAAQAFEELKSGKAYIAAYSGGDSQVVINKVYLGYYIGKTIQKNLMPVIVFEGENGFFAYVSAVQDSSLE